MRITTYPFANVQCRGPGGSWYLTGKNKKITKAIRPASSSFFLQRLFDCEHNILGILYGWKRGKRGRRRPVIFARSVLFFTRHPYYHIRHSLCNVCVCTFTGGGGKARDTVIVFSWWRIPSWYFFFFFLVLYTTMSLRATFDDSIKRSFECPLAKVGDGVFSFKKLLLFR